MLGTQLACPLYSKYTLRFKQYNEIGTECANLICTVQRYDGNTARLARRSDEALGVRVSVARIAPSLLDLGRGVPTGVHPTLNWKQRVQQLLRIVSSAFDACSAALQHVAEHIIEDGRHVLGDLECCTKLGLAFFSSLVFTGAFLRGPKGRNPKALGRGSETARQRELLLCVKWGSANQHSACTRNVRYMLLYCSVATGLPTNPARWYRLVLQGFGKVGSNRECTITPGLHVRRSRRTERAEEYISQSDVVLGSRASRAEIETNGIVAPVTSGEETLLVAVAGYYPPAAFTRGFRSWRGAAMLTGATRVRERERETHTHTHPLARVCVSLSLFRSHGARGTRARLTATAIVLRAYASVRRACGGPGSIPAAAIDVGRTARRVAGDTCPLHAVVQPMRAIEVSIKQRLNERAGEAGDPRENPLTDGIVRHDSHMRKSGDQARPGIEPAWYVVLFPYYAEAMNFPYSVGGYRLFTEKSALSKAPLKIYLHKRCVFFRLIDLPNGVLPNSVLPNGVLPNGRIHAISTSTEHQNVVKPSRNFQHAAETAEIFNVMLRVADVFHNKQEKRTTVKEAVGIAERRMEGARVCEAELVASSSHQTALGLVRSVARASLQYSSVLGSLTDMSAALLPRLDKLPYTSKNMAIGLFISDFASLVIEGILLERGDRQIVVSRWQPSVAPVSHPSVFFVRQLKATHNNPSSVDQSGQKNFSITTQQHELSRAERIVFNEYSHVQGKILQGVRPSVGPSKVKVRDIFDGLKDSKKSCPAVQWISRDRRTDWRVTDETDGCESTFTTRALSSILKVGRQKTIMSPAVASNIALGYFSKYLNPADEVSASTAVSQSPGMNTFSNVLPQHPMDIVYNEGGCKARALSVIFRWEHEKYTTARYAMYLLCSLRQERFSSIGWLQPSGKHKSMELSTFSAPVNDKAKKITPGYVHNLACQKKRLPIQLCLNRQLHFNTNIYTSAVAIPPLVAGVVSAFDRGTQDSATLTHYLYDSASNCILSRNLLAKYHCPNSWDCKVEVIVWWGAASTMAVHVEKPKSDGLDSWWLWIKEEDERGGKLELQQTAHLNTRNYMVIRIRREMAEFRAIEDEQRVDQWTGSLRLRVSNSEVSGWQGGLLDKMRE
ncbi:hypothetical protein PR048_024914 [Dryococelus australis]|uniref:Uncharacterized protein n=1 Tax=Dryococelus australis TaxID=614101 RepID=A0ABQ9GQ00_9NEOP|nr:hypothetical protein PR048_024914 [Dryococelus australis]